MKSFLVVTFCLFVTCMSLDLDEFSLYKLKFKRLYNDPDEELARKAIFENNLKLIKEHNDRFESKLETYKKGVNQFTDMGEDEFLEYVGGFPKFNASMRTRWPGDEAFLKNLSSRVSAPDAFNWIDEGGVTSVKNQGGCGSCSIFSVTATIDTCFFKASGSLFDDLSEQYLVDCAYGHDWEGWVGDGCSGGWPQAYFDFVQNTEAGGMQTEGAYPYTGTQDACQASADGYYSVYLRSWRNVWGPSEDEVKTWVAEVGPVVTTLYVGDDFSSYGGGVLDSKECCDQISDLECWYKNNHAITVVGYGTDAASGLDYWLIKNSWGSDWGDNGYIKVKRGTGHCGLFGHSASGPDACSLDVSRRQEEGPRHHG